VNGDRSRVSRRRALGVVGAGLATALAGCGYQTGAGDLDWTESYGWADGSGNPTGDRGNERWWGATANRLVSVRNRNGRTHEPGDGWVDVEDAQIRVYDSSGDSRKTTGLEPQCRNSPVAVDGSVFLVLENGTLAAVDVLADGDDRDRSWTTAEPVVPIDADGEGEDEPESTATVTGSRDNSVVAVEYDGVLACVDVETGTVRSELEVDEADGSLDHVAVGGDRVWTVHGGNRLRGYDPDGTERVERTLADGGEVTWLVGTGSSVSAGVTDANGDARTVVLAPDGDVRIDLDRALESTSGSHSRAPLVVGERLYLLGGRSVVAVDVNVGEKRWTRDSPFESFGENEVVADEEGIYGYGSDSDDSSASTGCPLVALSSDGEVWWTAETPADVDCSSELYVVGDRLVATDTGRVYGFRRTSGRRYTIL
jgi:hypothetical protein